MTDTASGRTSPGGAAQSAWSGGRAARTHARRGGTVLLTAAALTAAGALSAGMPATAASTIGSHGPDAATGVALAQARPAHLDRTLTDPRIVESSGLARSRYTRGALWTHNDSGGGPYLYKVGKGGATLARFRVANAPAYDWEALAGAERRGRSYLFVGDIGDNASKRSTILVHRVREPGAGATGGTLTPTTYEFRYPDGSHDAETLMVKPRSMRIYIVSKAHQGPGAIYVAPRNPSTTHLNTLRKVASAPTGLPDGVFLNRKSFVLRGYTTGYYYRRLGSRPVQFKLPLSGESITRGWNRHNVLIGEEGRDSQVWRVPLP